MFLAPIKKYQTFLILSSNDLIRRNPEPLLASRAADLKELGSPGFTAKDY
jgi:hypothetical protein